MIILNRKIHIITIVFLAALLLSGCINTVQKSTQTNTPTKTPIGCSPQITRYSKDLTYQESNFSVLKFVSSNVGWIAGNGFILKTIDGGNTWRKVYSGNQKILQIEAIDSEYEIAATPTGLLYSHDEGDNWLYENVDFGPGKGQINQVILADEHIAHILKDGVIYKFNLEDHSSLKENLPTYVDSIYFVSADLGFASCGNTVWKTTDSGKLWTKIYTAPVENNHTYHGWKSIIQGSSAKNLWLLVYGGAYGMSQEGYVAFQSSDSGNQWLPFFDEGYFSPAYPHIHPKVPSSELQMFFTGPFTVVKPQYAYFLGWNANNGNNIVIMTNSSGSWKSYRVQGFKDYTQVSVNISFSSPLNGWIVENDRDKSELLKTNDGGRKWSIVIK